MECRFYLWSLSNSTSRGRIVGKYRRTENESTLEWTYSSSVDDSGFCTKLYGMEEFSCTASTYHSYSLRSFNYLCYS